MALQLSYTDIWNNTYTQAYVMLKEVVINKAAKRCALSFSIYPTKQNRESNPDMVLTHINLVVQEEDYDVLMSDLDEEGRPAFYEYGKENNELLATGSDV